MLHRPPQSRHLLRPHCCQIPPQISLTTPFVRFAATTRRFIRNSNFDFSTPLQAPATTLVEISFHRRRLIILVATVPLFPPRGLPTQISLSTDVAITRQQSPLPSPSLSSITFSDLVTISVSSDLASAVATFSDLAVAFLHLLRWIQSRLLPSIIDIYSSLSPASLPPSGIILAFNRDQI